MVKVSWVVLEDFIKYAKSYRMDTIYSRQIVTQNEQNRINVNVSFTALGPVTFGPPDRPTGLTAIHTVELPVWNGIIQTKEDDAKAGEEINAIMGQVYKTINQLHETAVIYPGSVSE